MLGGSAPGGFLTDEEIGVVDAEADLVSLLADVPVAEGLEGGEEEGAGCGEVGDCQADVGDGHCCAIDR